MKLAILKLLDECAKSWNPDDFAELYDLLKRYYPDEVQIWDDLNEIGYIGF